MYPNTEVSKYYGLEDRRLSERKLETGGYGGVGEKGYKYEANNGTYVVCNVNGKQQL